LKPIICSRDRAISWIAALPKLIHPFLIVSLPLLRLFQLFLIFSIIVIYPIDLHAGRIGRDEWIVDDIGVLIQGLGIG